MATRLSSRYGDGPRRQAARCRSGILLLLTGLQMAGASAALDEVVVTGLRSTPIDRVPRSVSVISEADIALAPSTTLVDLLAREANVNLRSLTGNDKFAGVDIRGMGDTYTSNVVVLVDGIRLNSPDAQGADLSAVALDQVQRIEVVRGANAVRYGNGAVGGVINIITRAVGAEPGISGAASLGSFDTREVSLAASAGTALRASGRASWQDTDGYRENGDLRRLDLLLGVSGSLQPGLELSATAQFHDDDYGLPGPVSAEAFRGTDAERRASRWPDDGGETRDDRYRVALNAEMAGGRTLNLVGWARDRRNDYVLGYSPLLPRAEQLGGIDEDTLGGEALLSFPIEGGPGRQLVTAGLAASQSDYVRRANGQGLVGRSSALNEDLRDFGAFIATEWQLTERWQLVLGHRENRTRLDAFSASLVEVCDFVEILGLQVPVDCRPENQRSGVRDEDWDNSATDAGVVFAASPAVTAFLNYSRAFRVPNVDELAFAPVDLVPQRSKHLDAGARLRLAEGLAASFTAFFIRVEDEILFGADDTGFGANQNAPESTERRGFETEVRWLVTDTLTTVLSAGYTRAEFARSGAPLPLVPEWTTALGLRWNARPGLVTSVAARYVDDRTDGNDFSGNTYPELDAYLLVDLKLLWQAGRVGWSAGVSNAFDEVAATSGYGGSVYPVSGRSVFAGFSFSL